MIYIKINGEVINLNRVNFIRYDGYKILLYTDDIYNLSYVIDSIKLNYDEPKRVIWYNFMVQKIEGILSIKRLDDEFENFWNKTKEEI